MSATSSNKYIIGLDVGTTSIRCHIINSKAECVSVSSKQINLLYPKLGYVEINPEELWNSVCDVIKQAVKNANISPLQIASLGLCTQRATFVTWRKDNGQPFHNFITWKDLRANALVQQWRNSVLIKGLQMTCYVLYLVSRNKRCHAASSLKLLNTQVTLRLLWALQNIPELKEAVRNKNALFGTIDTWLIYKFTAGQKHVTDITNASATGFYDPFFLTWSSWAKVLFKIPYDILPEVVDNDYSFGSTQMSTFGFSVPITCVISDQSASTFGSCCFNAGDIKITLGTGSFLDVNTRYNIYSSAAGLYPLVGWKIDNDITYFIEGACNDAGSVIQWALKTNLIEDVQESSALANTVDHTDGVYFIPAFSGLGPPIMDENAASGFLGLKATSTKQHMIRAILESIVYRITLLYDMLIKEINYKIKTICVDGGVSNNNFICQLLANLLKVEVERVSTSEKTILGVTFIAGLKSGIWKNQKQIKDLRVIDQVFKPSTDELVYEKCFKEFQMWLKAVDRFKSWYN